MLSLRRLLLLQSYIEVTMHFVTSVINFIVVHNYLRSLIFYIINFFETISTKLKKILKAKKYLIERDNLLSLKTYEFIGAKFSLKNFFSKCFI